MGVFNKDCKDYNCLYFSFVFLRLYWDDGVENDECVKLNKCEGSAIYLELHATCSYLSYCACSACGFVLLSVLHIDFFPVFLWFY